MFADIARLEEALAGLERRLFDQGAPVGRQLRAGLTDGEIEVFTAGLPFRFSDELRCFYRWHDGVEELSRPNWPYFPCGGGGLLAPLHQAVEDYRRWAATPPLYDEIYQPAWFPINSLDGRSHVVDCGVEAGQTSPVRYVDHKDEWNWDCAPSLLAAVELWNRMLDEGYWVYNREAGDWEDHYAEIPLELRHTDLV